MNTIKNLAIFALGAGIGAFTTNYLLRTKYEQLAQEEIDSVKAHFSKRFPETVSEAVAADNGTYSDPVSEMTDEEYEDRIQSVAQHYTGNKEQRQRVEYNRIRTADPETAALYPTEDPSEEDYKCQAMSAAANNGDRKMPYVITAEGFSESMMHFDKITLTYYEMDDTLVDDREELIHDVDTMVSQEMLTRFGEGSEDEDVVYVRNEKLTSDYEIIRVHKSYQETVLGILPEKVKKKKAAAAKKVTDDGAY